MCICVCDISIFVFVVSDRIISVLPENAQTPLLYLYTASKKLGILCFIFSVKFQISNLQSKRISFQTLSQLTYLILHLMLMLSNVGLLHLSKTQIRNIFAVVTILTIVKL